MQVNEFGGGAAVITATGSTFIDAQDWAEETAEKLSSALQPA